MQHPEIMTVVMTRQGERTTLEVWARVSGISDEQVDVRKTWGMEHIGFLRGREWMREAMAEAAAYCACKCDGEKLVDGTWIDTEEGPCAWH